MAAVTLANCTIRRQKEGEVESVYVITPSTFDSADTIDLTALLQGRTISFVTAWDTTGEDLATATLSSNVVTIDASGGTTNHTYVVQVDLINLDPTS